MIQGEKTLTICLALLVAKGIYTGEEAERLIFELGHTRIPATFNNMVREIKDNL